MTPEIEHIGGWLIPASAAWWILAGWAVIVLLYGLYRSLGDASQDPIRPSGPFPEE